MDGQIDHGHRRIVEGQRSRVTRDPHNFRIEIAVTHAPADRILAREKSPGDRLADDRDGAARRIPFVELASRDHRNADGTEVVWADPIPVIRLAATRHTFESEGPRARTAGHE